MTPETCQNCKGPMERHLPPWYGAQYTVWICPVCSPDYDGFGECGDYMGFTLEEAKNNCPWAEELRED